MNPQRTINRPCSFFQFYVALLRIHHLIGLIFRPTTLCFTFTALSGRTHSRQSIPSSPPCLTSVSSSTVRFLGPGTCAAWARRIIMRITSPCVIKKSRNVRRPSMTKTTQSHALHCVAAVLQRDDEQRGRPPLSVCFFSTGNSYSNTPLFFLVRLFLVSANS